MVINGKEIDFKISRKSDAERFEKAINKMSETEKHIRGMKEEKNTLAEILEALRGMFADFFKEVSKGVDVVGECDDMEEIQGMYFAFLQDVEKQKKTFLSPFSAERIK